MPLDLLQRRWLRAALLLIVALPVLLIAINGLFVRPYYDDWCFIRSAQAHGLWGAPIYYYETWTATLSSSFVQSAVALSGPWAVGLMMLLLTIGWWAALIWLAREAALWLSLRDAAYISVLGGTLLTLAVLSGLPNLTQALYWASGAATYVTPMLLLTLILALLVRRLRGVTGRLVLDLAAVATLTATAGFFAPTYAAVQVTLFVLLTGLLLLTAHPTQRRAVLPLLLTALGVALIVLVVYLTAPGTSARVDGNAYYREGLSLMDMGLEAVVQTLAFLVGAPTIFGPWTLLLTLLTAGITGYALTEKRLPLLRRHWRQVLLLSGSILTILVLAAMSTIAFVSATALPARAFPVIQLPMVLTTAVWGFVLGQRLRHAAAPPDRLTRNAVILLTVLLILGPGLATVEALSMTPQFITFQQEWHTRDALLRQQVADGERNGTAAPFTYNIADTAQVERLGSDPTRTYNQCAAEYYGFNTLTIIEGE